MDPPQPSSSAMFEGAQHFSARGGQYNATGGDMRQGVVLHINYSEGRDTAPPPALQNPADALREPRANVDSGPSLPATYRVANAKLMLSRKYRPHSAAVSNF